MVNTSPEGVAAPVPQPAVSLLSRFIGIITAPKDTFAAVAAHPRWLGMLALTTVIVAIGTTAPLLTEGGKQSMLDQQVQMLERFGMTIPDEAYAQMQQRLRYAAPQQFVSALVGIPVLVLVLAGILFGIFAIVGGQASFKQLFAVVVHAGVIFAASLVFLGPLNYFRESMSGATNLAVLLPMLDEHSFLGRLFGMIDLFWIWWLIVLAIGLGVLYRRRTQPIAVTLFSIYGVFILGFAAIMGMFGRSN
jgi:hypothetical protein